jgi:GMP synthase-like glutamine amidotransferase
MSGPTVLVVQHIACEPPATYEDVLVERGMQVHRVEVDEGDALPHWDGYRAVVVMGGPMGANDDGEHPWLVAEKAFLAGAAADDVPIWGVCLGAQLLAAVLGGRVSVGHRPEVGIGSVELTDAAAADPVFGGLPRHLEVFQWHSDTFELPPGARVLATSREYPNQAFSWRRCYGLQFHAEVGPALAAQWAAVPSYVASLEAVHGPGALPRLLTELRDGADASEALARQLFNRWLSRVVGAADRAELIA